MQLLAGAKLKPFYPELQVESGFALGLIGAWIAMPGYSAGFRDYGPAGLNANFPTNWSPSPVPSPYGPAWLYDSVNNHLATTPTLALNPTAGTIAAVFDPATIATTSYLVSNSTSGFQSLSIGLQTNNRIRFTVGATSTTQNTDSPIYPSDWFTTWHTVVARYGPSGQFLWVDGVMVVSKPPTTFAPPANDYLTFGGRLGVSSTYTIDSVFAYSREFSDSEIALWSADPWWGFRPKRRPFVTSQTVTAAKPWIYSTRVNQLIGAY